MAQTISTTQFSCPHNFCPKTEHALVHFHTWPTSNAFNCNVGELNGALRSQSIMRQFCELTGQFRELWIDLIVLCMNRHVSKGRVGGETDHMNVSAEITAASEYCYTNMNNGSSRNHVVMMVCYHGLNGLCVASSKLESVLNSCRFGWGTVYISQ